VILLLGGTSETAASATALLTAGQHVLVSTATTVPLELPEGAARRAGRLDEEAMSRLIWDVPVHAIVDATHPYAQEAHVVALRASARTGIPCIRWVRPNIRISERAGILIARDHTEAARLACAAGPTVLLTVGSQHLATYVAEAAAKGRRLVARVLPAPASLDACRQAGLTEADVIAARGPFSVEENRAALRQFRVGVLVTKDSGAAGGVAEKITAARLEQCRVVLIQRPLEVNANRVSTLAELLGRAGPRT
jgi:precorrin-6A/cobalt-precorrin-6A reductase